jgi:uncharacterized protein (TIGR02594 family)
MLSTASTIDQNTFAQCCLNAARDAGTNAHYLIAVAYVESGIKNVPAPGSTGFGPFQIMEQTWSMYMGGLGLTPNDRFNPYMQPGVAAKIAADGTTALRAVLPDNRLPTAQELYFVHLFGQHGATVILGSGSNRSIKDALLQVYAGPNAENNVDTIIAANKPLMTDANGQPLIIDALLQAVGQRLDQGLATAVTVINNVEPDLFSGPTAPAAAGAAVPWMTVAKQELASGVVEGNPRIKQYFIATTLNPVPPGHVAWCAAFVAYCIYNCGDPGKRKPESARAEEWLKIGTGLGGPGYGSVAVLEPLVAGSSGHVGFVVSWNADTLQLLAGNQPPPGGAAHAVCIREFKMTQVRGWRMP